MNETSRLGESPRKPNQALGGERGARPRRRRSMLFPILMVMAGCVVLLFAAWSAVRSPVLASIMSPAPRADQPAPAKPFAQVMLPKPTFTPASLPPAEIVVLEVTPTITFTSESATATQNAVAVADLILPTMTPSVEAAQPTEDTSTGVAYAEIVQDTPTPEYVAPTVAPYLPQTADAMPDGVHWIDVDLSQQRLYAYAGDTLMRSFVVSTGTWQTPTVTGKYKVWIKLRSTDMSGPGYYVPNVPFTMYFYKGYGIHGTYWHNNFGTPMSHGCVNMTIPDAEWVYNFSVVGTVVNVHY